MSLIIALGTNLGEREKNLAQARSHLEEHFQLVQYSSIYAGPAVDYLDQPDFLNQVGEFILPSLPPLDALKIMLGIEQKLGRLRKIPKGPRLIDLDIIFWGHHRFDHGQLQIPHPRWHQREFVIKPLMELPWGQKNLDAEMGAFYG